MTDPFEVVARRLAPLEITAKLDRHEITAMLAGGAVAAKEAPDTAAITGLQIWRAPKARDASPTRLYS
jgi:hypothetical protein